MHAQRRSLLTPEADPNDVLCRHFNVSRPVIPPTFRPDADIPPTIELRLLRTGTRLPSHVLAISPSNPPIVDEISGPIAPIFLPIDIVLYSSRIPIQVPLPSSLPAPVISAHSITLPVVPFTVPHPPTLALLLLFALRLEPDLPNNLGYRLLPPSAIEEFPNKAAMSSVLARVGSTREGFTRLLERNEGLWWNVLALGIKDKDIVDLVRLVWNVTSDAKKARIRAAAAARAQ